MQIIKTDKLTKYYGKNRGITELNLTVEEGDFFGFIGPNGAGKSTTIRTLLGLISPNSGSAQIFGKDIQSCRQEILSEIGYMPSEATFYQGMKVREIISLSAKMRKVKSLEEADKLCERLSLDKEKRVEELSLGNRKKVSIVCALLHKPRLCILDEPTSGLDPLMQNEFFEILKQRHEDGATIFLSSHVLSEIQKHCSHAAIIKDGKIISQGTVAELSQNNAKRVILHGITSLPEILDAKSAEAAEDSISFLYTGNIKDLISTVNTLPITDMTIREPSLEEIFMHFYEKTES